MRGMLLTLCFIIFGWPLRTKDIGPAFHVDCPDCRNRTMYNLVKARRWLTLYTLPAMPLSFKRHYLVCEVCGKSVGLEGDDVDLAKEAAGVVGRFEAGELTEDECMERVGDLAVETAVFADRRRLL